MKMVNFMFCCSLLFITAELKAHPILQGGSEKADSLLSVVSREISAVNPAKALQLATEALSLSSDIGYSKGKAISCFYIGQIISYLGDFQKSLEYLSLSEQERYSKNNTIMQSEISRIKGQVYYQLKMEKSAFREFQKAHTLTSQIKDKADRDRYTSLAYENLSIAYHLIKEMPDSSLYWLNRNEELLLTTDESVTFRNRVNLYSHYGEHYTRQQQYDTATSYFEKAEVLIRKYNYPYSSWLYQRWGDLHAQKGNNDSAMIFYQKGLNNLMTTKLKNELPGLYERVAGIHSNLGNEDSARIYREKYLQLSAELGDARLVGAEEAFTMLLKEEKRISNKRIRGIILLAIIFSGIAIAASTVIIGQSIIKRRKKESEVSELKLKLNDAFDEVIELAKTNESSFLPRFKEVYPKYANNLLKRHPDLTNNELRLSAMIFLHFTSKEIAEYMFITHRSVQTSKSRLRKKLDIPSEADLYQYFKSFS